MSGKIISTAVRLTAAAALVVLGVGMVAVAEPTTNRTSTEAQKPAYERVDSFPALTHLYGWQVVDDKNVIVWSTPYQPYLVELAQRVPAHELLTREEAEALTR